MFEQEALALFGTLMSSRPCGGFNWLGGKGSRRMAEEGRFTPDALVTFSAGSAATQEKEMTCCHAVGGICGLKMSTFMKRKQDWRHTCAHADLIHCRLQ